MLMMPCWCCWIACFVCVLLYVCRSISPHQELEISIAATEVRTRDQRKLLDEKQKERLELEEALRLFYERMTAT